MPDSVPASRRASLKLPDSVGASYENGKLQLPSSPGSNPFGNKTDALERPGIKLDGDKMADQLKRPDLKDQLQKKNLRFRTSKRTRPRKK